MTRSMLPKFLVSALTFLAGAAFAATASASSIQTFGAQTQYQDAYPDQYDLCLTVDSSLHLVSDVCANLANQQLAFDGAHITYTVSHYNPFTHRFTTTTYYATNRGSYVSMEGLGSGAIQDWVLDGSNLINDAGGCLEVQGGDTSASGAPMDVAGCNGTQAQWFWTPGPHTFQLYNLGSGSCLTEQGTGYAVSGCVIGSSAQEWLFTNDQQIQNVATGHCILESGSTLTPVACDATYWTAGQEWSGGTTVYGFFQSYSSGGCLTDVNGIARTAACSSPSAGNTSQFWVER